MTRDNGLKLIDMATKNNFLLKSIMLEHKRMYKEIWKSDDGRMEPNISRDS